MDMVATNEALQDLCRGFAGEEFVAVDTEFMREQTYWPELCLIQIAGSRRQAIIDPLAEGIDLQPFFDLLNDTAILKVFHAARQDIEIFVHRSGTVPNPVFDTQVAAMVCGFGEQVGYEAIVRKLARAQIDKSSRFTDWSRRPLSEKQLAYALSDVTHLRTVYLELKRELDRTGREPWLAQEMNILTSPATYRTEPEDAWRRIKVRLRSRKQLAVLQHVAAWREHEARDRDVPRARVVKDDAIAEIATQMPQSRDALAALRSLPRGFASSRHGDAIVAAVKQALATPQEQLPDFAPAPGELNDAAQSAAEILKLALKIVCEQHGIAPKLVATSSEIEAFANGGVRDSPISQGWRREVFGNLAQELLAGQADIGFRNGRATIVRSGSKESPAAAAE